MPDLVGTFFKAYDNGTGYEEWINLRGLVEVAVDQPRGGALVVDLYYMVQGEKSERRLTGNNAVRFLVTMGFRQPPLSPVPEDETRLVRDFTDLHMEPIAGPSLNPQCLWDDA